MSANYTFDADLDTVLQAASNEELAPLVQFIKASSFSERLTSDDSFVRYYPNHARYCHVISAEIRAFGGHTIVNLLRGGKGPDYHTVVADVLKHMKIDYQEDDNIFELERKLIAYVMKDMYGKMDNEQRELIVSEVKQYQANDGALVVKALEKGDLAQLSPKALLLLSSVISSSIAKIMGVSVSISNALGSALGQSANKIQTLLNMSVDVLYSIFNSIYEFGGPAYKVTVPCVIHVAMLRVKQSSCLLEYQKPCDPNLTLAHATSDEPSQAQAQGSAQEQSPGQEQCPGSGQEKAQEQGPESGQDKDTDQDQNEAQGSGQGQAQNQGQEHNN